MFRQILFDGFGLQAVRITDRLDGVDDETILGASATLGARTSVGPLLNLGVADDDSVQLHFGLGRLISKGSLLNRLH